MAHPRFGYCLPIFANPGNVHFRTPNYPELDTATTMNLGRFAEELGYHSLWVADHLMLGKDEAILEGWTVLSALAGSTSRATIGMIHQAHFFRHPALTAKMVATLDQVSGGRLIHFYDVGQQKPEHHAYGIFTMDDDDERAASMIEGLELTIKLWTSRKPVDYQGQYFHVDGAVCTPRPLQHPHPPIWLGETHPDILRAVARYAQGWNTMPLSVSDFRRRLDLVQDACEREGRSFDELEISLELQVIIEPDQESVRQRLREMLEFTPGGLAEVEPELAAYARGETEAIPESFRATTLIGTPNEVRQQLQEYIDAGADHIMLWFLDAPSTDGMRLFARDVMPAFRSV
jgi:alkanesulfonate monooxygenase SsuD/methylene tetrahydromethanopterin reductase-like flavin-dependent oxidoreductase (luciferase family)